MDKVVIPLDAADPAAAEPDAAEQRATAPVLVRELPPHDEREAGDEVAEGSLMRAMKGAAVDVKGGDGLGFGTLGRSAGGLGLRGVGRRGGGGLGVGGVGGGMGRGRTARARMRLGRPRVMGALTAMEAWTTLRPTRKGLKFCYQMALTRKPSLAGTITVTWQVSASGQVQAAKVLSSSLKDPHIENCISRQLTRLRFPAKTKASTVLVPLVFTPPRPPPRRAPKP